MLITNGVIFSRRMFLLLVLFLGMVVTAHKQIVFTPALKTRVLVGTIHTQVLLQQVLVGIMFTIAFQLPALIGTIHTQVLLQQVLVGIMFTIAFQLPALIGTIHTQVLLQQVQTGTAFTVSLIVIVAQTIQITTEPILLIQVETQLLVIYQLMVICRATQPISHPSQLLVVLLMSLTSKYVN